MSFTTGGAEVTLNLPDNIYLDEPASGDCSVSPTKSHHRLMIIPENQHNEHCKVKLTRKDLENKNYQQNFTVTCKNGSASSVKILCFIIGSTALPTTKVVQGKTKHCYDYITCVHNLY